MTFICLHVDKAEAFLDKILLRIVTSVQASKIKLHVLEKMKAGKRTPRLKVSLLWSKVDWILEVFVWDALRSQAILSLVYKAGTEDKSITVLLEKE